jgi:hypothetical protein
MQDVCRCDDCWHKLTKAADHQTRRRTCSVCCVAALALVVCTACNLSSPIITGFLFEMLVGRGQHSMQRYPAFFAIFAAIYIIEPLLTRVYIKHMCAAGEKVSLNMLSYLQLQP